VTQINTNFLAALHNNINQYFSLEEIRTICFNLSIDYDSIPGEGKSAKTRELILALARLDRLPVLAGTVQEQRPNVPWPAIPADFQLPTSGPWSGPSQPTQNIHHGDVVHGNKAGDIVGGDKITGDKTTTGSISGSTGIAIGRGSNLIVNTQQGIPTEQLNALFAPLLQQAQQAPPEQQTILLNKVNQLKEETAKGEKAEDEAVAGLVQDIVDIVPSAVGAITGLFTNSIIAKSAGAATKFVLSRLKKTT
jgi:hypothetical protein